MGIRRAYRRRSGRPANGGSLDRPDSGALGFKAANANGDGRPELKSYLRYLAKHPATADRLATRLSTRVIQAGVGARVITLDYGGWDMCVGLGRVSDGDLKVHLSELAGPSPRSSPIWGPRPTRSPWSR